MGKITRVAQWLCILFACGLLIVTGTDQFQHLAIAHRGAPSYLLLSLILAVPVGVVTLAAGYLLEASLLGWSRSSLKMLRESPASVRLDALCMTMALLPLKLPGYLLSLGLFYAIDRHLLQTPDFSITRFLPTWGLQAGCLLLLQSFISYWIHRLEHTIPALWALHKFHHSADRMSIMTAVRQTELAKALELVVLVLFLALLSDPTAPKPEMGSPLFVIVAIYFVYRCFVRVNQYLVHSNLTTDYGWVGRWLLVSPRMHRLHHAMDPRYYNRNYTFDLVIWDRLFGTYASCDAKTADTIRLGLEDSPFNSGRAIKCVLRDYFLTPYIVFWRELRKGLKAWLPPRPEGAVHAQD
jgi:sterol desaturase/sphingolipid hydroxylase (fatty acid hydroxylase superfamily)